MVKFIGFGLAAISAAYTAHWMYGLSVASMGLAAGVITAVSGLLLGRFMPESNLGVLRHVRCGDVSGVDVDWNN